MTVPELKKTSGEVALGDVVISVETAAVQAKERGHSLKKELDILLVHGILHLLGYDHEYSKSESLRMRRMEKKILGHQGLIVR